MSSNIVFGTDGWRGIIARDFTFDNLALVAHATARYVKTLKVRNTAIVLGYDTRFLSKEFANETARILASYGIVVHLSDRFATTPQVSFHTKQKGAALGIVITASHNPAVYNGYKVKAAFGGPATPEQIALIEKELLNLKGKAPKTGIKSLDEYIDARTIRPFDASESYIRYVRKKIDIDLINASGLKVVYDPMHGAGIEFMSRLLPNVTEIHGEYNPSFGDVDHPEPIADCLRPLMEAVRQKKADIGIATDGDADRLGAIDEFAGYVDPHRIFMLLLKYLFEDKKRRGSVVKTVSLTSMVDAYCEKRGIKLMQTPVGFKHVAKLMNEEKVLIGGEESGGLGTSIHIPERDGVFNGLLLLEMLATRKKSLNELCDELDEEFGPHRFRRRDVSLTEAQKKLILAACARKPQKIGRHAVQKIDTMDGYKFFVDNGWLLIRASGTEPLIRFYAEAETTNRVEELLDEGLKLK